MTNFPKTRKQKKSHPFLTILIAAFVGCASGIAGGWFTVTHLKIPAVEETKTAPSSTQETQPVTNVETTVVQKTSLTKAVSKAAVSVVEIEIEGQTSSFGMFGRNYTYEGAGSGVIYSADGYIITNNHVIEDATKILVRTYDGKEYDAKLVGTDAKTDIAVIKVEATDLAPATLGDSSKIAAGDTAIVIGNPLGTLGGTVTDGIISAASREIVLENEAMELIQTNAEINSGNSGGGLFDDNGNLIGIVNAKNSGTTSSGTTIEGIGFAIPVNRAADVANELIKNGKVTNRATLGVYLQDVAQSTQHYKAGLYISQVIDGSGADQAGLKAYDRIISADGKDISSYSDLTAVLNKKKVGDTLVLKVERDGSEREFTVTLTGTLDTEKTIKQ